MKAAAVKLVETINEKWQFQLKLNTTVLEKNGNCSFLSLSRIISAQYIDMKKSESSQKSIVIQLEAKPKNVAYEATLSISTPSKSTNVYQVSDSIQRIDAYAPTSKCVSGPDIKPYCVCR